MSTGSAGAECATKGYLLSKVLKSGASATAIVAFALAPAAWAQTGPESGQGTAGTAKPTATATDPAATNNTSTAPSADTAAGLQEDNAPTSEDVIVTGIRQSLANAQNIKRNSDTVVDAITAQDIGALPDRSVTEALQRVPGVAINRFAGSNDPDHFSVEGSGVTVRGLTFVRSEFNGRDAFAAGIGGQAVNFADIPSELLGSVEVYKNATAELIEGGLAGTVNLNTRKPFDNKGFHVGFGAEANYGDFRKDWSPTGSLLVSNTWDTGSGEFGLLGSISYSEIRSRADGIQVTNFQTRDNVPVAAGNATPPFLICRNPLPSDSDTQTLPGAGADCGATGAAGADGFADYRPLAYAPIGGQFRTQDFNRKREGQAFAAQWRSNDRRTEITAQFLRSHSTNAWGEHTFETAPDLSEYSTYPIGCLQNNAGPLTNPSAPGAGNATTRAECPVGSFTNYQYDNNGLFEKGYITLPGTGWRTAGSGNANSFVPTGGIQQSLSRRQVFEENEILDAGLNLKTQLTDRLSVNVDAAWTRATRKNDDVSVFGSTFADQELDLTGDLPRVIAHKPLTLNASWATPNPELTGYSESEYFASRNVQFWRAAMDHFEDSVGTEWQFKGDATYKFDDGSFINRVKFGARFADREQTVRYTAYNWGAISEVWSGAPVSFAQGDTSRSSFFTFPDFFRGQTGGPPGGYYYNGDLIKDYNGATTFFQAQNDIWREQNGATASNRFLRADQRDPASNGSPYLPSEVQNVRQQDTNLYAQLNFGNDDPVFGDVRIGGNVGVRYVHTDIYSRGAIGIPTRDALGVADEFAVRCVPTTRPDGTVVQAGGVCTVGEAGYNQLRTFATGGFQGQTFRNDYTYWLPSANLKLGLSRDLVFRLAASKVLTRPDLDLIRPAVTYSLEPGSGTLTVQAGNPALRPATAWQFDATLEWYFARVGSLTFDAFYKEVDGFFYQAVVNRSVTNNGITQNIAARGPQNFAGKGKIKGFEAAYQQTLDFLPGLLSGFGLNANYTYIESSGLPNSFLNGGSVPTPSTIAPSGSLPLEGLSKHNVNAAAFYEKGPVSLRVAYNWRSRFLLTASDVIFPFTSIFNDAAGQLDASAFVNLTKQIKIGVQGVNLTNTVTKTLQAYQGNPDRLAPRSYFMNDRRFSFILRGNF